MKENELTIEIPDGKIVDWEESKKQNKIVLKDKQLTYEDVCNKLQDAIDITLFIEPSKRGHMFVADVYQLERIIAKNILANVAKYLNDGWKPKSGDVVCGFVLEGRNRNIVFPLFSWDVNHCYFPQFVFKDAEMAQRAIEILGEETIKLALEPLGI